MSNEKFNGLNINMKDLQLPIFNPASVITQNLLDDLDRQVEEINREREEQEELERKYKDSVLNALRGIEKNTGNLSEIAFLLKEGNVARDETYLLFEKMFSILNAKDKEEAESIYGKAMKKAGEFNTGVDVTNKLSNFGSMLFKMMFPEL
ncbi:hypothetical protein ACX1C1_21560 [Paenibacillus sp. strain BS8-2]